MASKDGASGNGSSSSDPWDEKTSKEFERYALTPFHLPSSARAVMALHVLPWLFMVDVVGYLSGGLDG